MNSNNENKYFKPKEPTVELASKKIQEDQPLTSKIKIVEEQEGQQQQSENTLTNSPSLSPVIA